MKSNCKLICMLIIISILNLNISGYINKFEHINNYNNYSKKLLIGIFTFAAVASSATTKKLLKKDRVLHIKDKNNITDFTNREQNWVKFLSGEEILDDSFLFKSCEAFRNANDETLENNHNFIQVVFPGLEMSKFDNKDLYLNRNIKNWQNLMKNLRLRLDIQEKLRLNLIRILEFFGFEIKLDDKFNITEIVADPSGVVFEPGNHNGLRLTRVLECLKIFGLDREHKLIINSINSNKKIIKSINQNSILRESYNFWLKSEQITCLY